VRQKSLFFVFESVKYNTVDMLCPWANGMVSVIDEFLRTWKGAVVICFKLLFHYFLAGI
jgi:hypothetical protein